MPSIDVDYIIFRSGGLTVAFQDGTEVTSDFKMVGGIWDLPGFNKAQKQALINFNRNRINQNAKLDPRLSNIDLNGGGVPDWSIIAIPSTYLYYANQDPYPSQMRNWIIDHVAEYNIKLITHLGDVAGHLDPNADYIVDDVNVAQEDPEYYWDQVLNDFDDLKYLAALSFVPGDRDYKQDSIDPLSEYVRVLDPTKYNERPWYVGSSPTGYSSFQRFKAGGLTFQHLGLSLEAKDDITWASTMLTNNRQHPTIISTHRYTDANDVRPPINYYEGLSPQEIYDALVQDNPHVFLVLSGDDYRNDGLGFNIDINNYGLPIWEIGFNAECLANNGDGSMMMITFSRKKNSISVRPFSSNQDDLETDTSRHFEIPVDYDHRFNQDFANLPIVPASINRNQHISDPRPKIANEPLPVFEPTVGPDTLDIWLSNGKKVEKAKFDDQGVYNRQDVFINEFNVTHVTNDAVARIVFYAAGDGIYRGDFDGSNNRLIMRTTGVIRLRIDVVNRLIYYSTSSAVNVCDYNGGAGRSHISNFDQILDFDISTHTNHIFILQRSGDNKQIVRYSIIDGTQRTMLQSPELGDTHAITVSDKVYILQNQSDGQSSIWSMLITGEEFNIVRDLTYQNISSAEMDVVYDEFTLLMHLGPRRRRSLNPILDVDGYGNQKVLLRLNNEEDEQLFDDLDVVDPEDEIDNPSGFSIVQSVTPEFTNADDIIDLYYIRDGEVVIGVQLDEDPAIYGHIPHTSRFIQVDNDILIPGGVSITSFLEERALTSKDVMVSGRLTTPGITQHQTLYRLDQNDGSVVYDYNIFLPEIKFIHYEQLDDTMLISTGARILSIKNKIINNIIIEAFGLTGITDVDYDPLNEVVIFNGHDGQRLRCYRYHSTSINNRIICRTEYSVAEPIQTDIFRPEGEHCQPISLAIDDVNYWLYTLDQSGLIFRSRYDGNDTFVIRLPDDIQATRLRVDKRSGDLYFVADGGIYRVINFETVEIENVVQDDASITQFSVDRINV